MARRSAARNRAPNMSSSWCMVYRMRSRRSGFLTAPICQSLAWRTSRAQNGLDEKDPVVFS